LQLDDPVHAFFRGGKAAFQNARSPNEAPKRRGSKFPGEKQARGSPHLKKKKKKKRKRKQKERVDRGHEEWK